MHDNHTLTTQSSHRTSQGTVTYLRCSCGQFLIRTRESDPTHGSVQEVSVG